MKEFLILQNYFGVPFELYYQGKRKYHTIIGIVLSLIINMTAISFLIFLLIELFSRSNPNVNNIHLSNRIGANLTVNTDDLIIAFNVLDKNFKSLNDPSVLRIDFNYIIRSSVDGEFTEKVTLMKFINCTEINYKKYQQHGLTTEFKSNSLHEYYCFNGTEGHDKIVLGGHFGYVFYAIIKVNAYKCINGTIPGVVCKSSEEINRRLAGSWFEVFFLDHYVDIYNYHSPIQTFSNGLFTQIDTNYLKNLYAYFSKLDLNSKNNVLVNSDSRDSTFKYEKLTIDIASINQGKLIDFTLISSITNEINNRYYIQLTTIAGNVAGILNAMNIAGSVFLYYVNHISYRSSLFNSLFEFYNKKPRKLNSLYTTDKTLKPDHNDRYKVKLELSLKKAFSMNLGCMNKVKRNEMQEEYKRIESVFFKYADYVSLIKNKNSLALIREKLMLYDKNEGVNRNLADKIELNVYQEQTKLGYKFALQQSTKFNLIVNQSKVIDSSFYQMNIKNNYIT